MQPSLLSIFGGKMATVKTVASRLYPAVVRGVRTFVQAFLAVLLVNGNNSIDLSNAKAAGIAGIAAVLSLVQNTVTPTTVETKTPNASS